MIPWCWWCRGRIRPPARGRDDQVEPAGGDLGEQRGALRGSLAQPHRGTEVLQAGGEPAALLVIAAVNDGHPGAEPGERGRGGRPGHAESGHADPLPGELAAQLAHLGIHST